MTTTTYKFGRHTVHIHDPSDTQEAKAIQQKRLEQACIRFWVAKEREVSRK